MKISPEEQLRVALAESEQLRIENQQLREKLGLVAPPATLGLPVPPTTPIPSKVESSPNEVHNQSPVDAKIALFKLFFRGRSDVYAVRWQNQIGHSGYSPVCKNIWNQKLCGKPKIKCNKCNNRELLPLSDDVLYSHLSGEKIVGLYPLLDNETCFFIAVDFDKEGWQDGARAYCDACRENQVPFLFERSRSGNGAHVWIFFDAPVQAVVARKLGAVLLTQAMEKKHQIDFKSYDRFFPCQDTLPEAGFGNLIALPLQKEAKASGNTLFMDEYLAPYPDQWRILSRAKRLSAIEADSIIKRLSKDGNVTGVRKTTEAEYSEDDPWTLPPSGRPREAEKILDMPKRIELVYANMIFIPKLGMPSSAINRLKKMAAFQNPEFYRKQAMRQPTYKIPRIISCSDEFERHIALPRGMMEEVQAFFEPQGVATSLKDERFQGNPIKFAFQGTLRPEQEKCVKALLKSDMGVLCASPAFGKTVVALWMIAARKRNTLILVHRQQLLDQWRERIALFLDAEKKMVGAIGGGHKTASGIIDVGIVQSLVRKGGVKDMVADYGHIIIDECHHVSAVSVELIMKQVKAKYILGLTATPLRKDGHHPIIIMQCGPIRFRTSPKAQTQEQPFDHIVIPRLTEFALSAEMTNVKIQDLYTLLTVAPNRNQMIADDVLRAVEAGRVPLLLTERTEHLDALYFLLKPRIKNIVVLRGGRTKKERKVINDALEAIPENEPRLIIAKGRYIGEGFDDARLDTLFLSLPVSWHGTIQQYAGRLHRLHDSKKEVQIYDYVDAMVPMLKRMHERRLKGYKRIGYRLQCQ